MEKVIDVLKEGVGPEKMIYLAVDGQKICAIHLGSYRSPGNPERVIINLNPQLWSLSYKTTIEKPCEKQGVVDKLIVILEK